MAFAAYLFDLDGTLVDSVELILMSFHHTRQVHFGDRLDDGDYIRTMGQPLRDVFRSMAASSDEADAMVRTYVEFNLARHDDMVRPYPGVPAMIRGLVDRGARIGVVTSKLREHALRGLRVSGLSDAIEHLVGADDVVHGKPDPEPVLRMLGALGVSASDAIFVGDSPHDVEAGHRAGVTTAAATWGPFTRAELEKARPTFWLAQPADVVELARST